MLLLALSERPRERLARYGSEALSNLELLAILLGSGSAKKNVLNLASELLERFGSLDALFSAKLEELLEIKGIGKAKAVQLKAALALGKRLLEFEAESCFVIENASSLASLLRPGLALRKTEAALLLLCDAKRRVFHRETIAVGTLSEVLLHPREVFSPAIRQAAHSIIVAHNHPSGDPSPSKRDIEMTLSLEAAGHLLGICLFDHLIVARSGYFSFREKGLINRAAQVR